jgi:hypothetical protein
MPRESDQRRLATLRRVFADTASDVPVFTRTARTGGYREDEGLENLLPAEFSLYEKTCLLKAAVVRFLDDGKHPTVEESGGNAEMDLEPANFYHFRVEVEGVRLFVKVLYEDDEGEPGATVISVKRDDRSWE